MNRQQSYYARQVLWPFLLCIVVFPTMVNALALVPIKILSTASFSTNNRYSIMKKLYMTHEDDQEDEVNSFPTHQDHHISRRAAFFTMASAVAATTVATATFSQPAIAIDGATSIKKDTLQDIIIGKGIWTDQNESNYLLRSSSLPSSLNIPTMFITYMTRFLINYDVTISGWWQNDVLLKYSLLGENLSYNQQLENSFSSLAKSIELSIVDYVCNGMVSSDPNQELVVVDTLHVQKRFESLLLLFVNSYTKLDGEFVIIRDEEEKMSQLMLLFSMLPPQYQPIQELQKIASKIRLSNNHQDIEKQQLAETDFSNNQAKMLPSNIYTSKYDALKQSYTINPPIKDQNHSSLKLNELVFGSIALTPLKRQRPNLSFNIYSMLGICGATGCALTHTLVIPFDVVKTKLQANPEEYKNLIDGVISISKEKTGMNTFFLGSQATIFGYFWYGLSVYPCYSFSKWYMENVVFDPALAVINTNLISLIAGAVAAVVASIGLTPIEACRIRTVAEPNIYRELGLIGTMKSISREDLNLGWKTLYAGFPSLVTRQVIFGSVKFLLFERTSDAIFSTFPSFSETTSSTLGVTLFAGALSGFLSSVISQPADSILTYVAKNKVENATFGVLEGGMMMVEKEGIGSLFRGLGSRSLWASAIISGQFFLYDIFRNILGINTQDLTQVFSIEFI